MGLAWGGGGGLVAQSGELATLDLRVVSSSLAFDVEVT